MIPAGASGVRRVGFLPDSDGIDDHEINFALVAGSARSCLDKMTYTIEDNGLEIVTRVPIDSVLTEKPGAHVRVSFDAETFDFFGEDLIVPDP